MIPIDQYAYTNRLSNVHPLEKMVLALSFLLFAVITKDVLISLITFFVMSTFILFAAKIPLSLYCKLLLLPGFFLLTSIFSILISFTTSTLPPHYWSMSFGSVQLFIGKASVDTAFHLFFSVLASISCLYFIALTTPISAITYAMRQLKIPIIFIELCELTYRFIFVFLQSMQAIYEAQQSRLGYQKKRRWFQSVGYLVTAMFKDVFRRSKQLHEAMASRCYNEDISSHYVTYQTERRNWLGIGVSLCLLSAVYLGGFYL
ncbi:cobalt ECF transporter T component CbiQ [Kurthia gibsonii]|uniref:cobalt ECF transporter T component CbiQ n=1 Tax=Kurthia gibsonii TaxID=33946 RepID=UPI0034CFB37B